jgi:hypothetical protein
MRSRETTCRVHESDSGELVYARSLSGKGEAMQTTLDGFGDLVRQLEEATHSLDTLEGEVAQLSVEPGDAARAQITMRQIEAAIVRQTAACCGNPLVGDLAKELRKTLGANMVQSVRD